MCRIENACNKGMSDVEGVLSGAQFWLELKIVEAPKDPAKALPVKFQAGQVDWLTRRKNAGGHCGILLKVCGQAKKPRVYLISAAYAGLVEDGLAEARLLEFGRLVTTPEDTVILASRL
jgi:hypothetical protein